MMPPAMKAFVDTKAKSKGVKLLVQGGRTSGADVFKALALGADAVGLDIAAALPFGKMLKGAPKELEGESADLDRFDAIIGSMTPEERRKTAGAGGERAMVSAAPSGCNKGV